MSLVAIICEYNPFHNGHAYHMAMARQLSGADTVLCLMSGSAVQRGEPAIFDKWSRARMAIAAGADIVIELPLVYAMASAGRFASGAIELLARTGIVTHLAFGTEDPHPQALLDLAEVLADPPHAWHQHVRDALSRGLSYPAARQAATRHLLEKSGHPILARSAARVMSLPNNILALEYLTALTRSASGITPVMIPRQGSGYHDPRPSVYPSATAVRRALLTGETDLIRTMVPEEAYEVMREQMTKGRGPVNPEDLDTISLYALRRMTPDEIAACPDMEPGLAERFHSAARRAGTRDTLRQTVKSKRYTMTRIDRILMYALLGITADDMALSPQYSRLLGFSSSSTKILLQMKKKTDLLIINRLKPALEILTATDPDSLRCLSLDIAATDLQALLFANPFERAAGQDYTTSPLRL